jgi:hypothetical protein
MTGASASYPLPKFLLGFWSSSRYTHSYMSDAKESAPDGMQFEQAEYVKPEGSACSSCGNSIETTYWHWGGNVICPNCAELVKESQKTPPQALLLKGALYALGTAFACAIGYATILIVTNYEIGIVAIGVGWAVGTAARKGTGGAGGRALQVVAVVATYMAICFSLAVQVLYSSLKEGKALELFGVLITFIVSLGKPVLEIVYEGLGGVIGVLILFFGLQQAWQQTGNVSHLLMGPYQKEEEKAGNAAA